MSAKENVEVMVQIFNAIEQRDAQRALELFHPDVEFHWPPSLPYGGTFVVSNPIIPLGARLGTRCSQPELNARWITES